MLPQAIAEPLTPSPDARGFVVEPPSLAQLTAQQNVHVVWTAAGALQAIIITCGARKSHWFSVLRWSAIETPTAFRTSRSPKGPCTASPSRPKSHMPSVLWGRSRCFSWGSTQRSTYLSTQTHSQTTYSERMTLPSSDEGAA